MEHILSFDIAKGKSVYCLIDENRKIIIDSTSINHNKNEFDQLFNLVSNYNSLTVIMESTSVYHLPVENYFRSKGINTIVINPKLVKQYKDTLNKSKTDKIDCFKIARCYLGTIDFLYQKNDEYLIYNPLARQYWSLIESQTRLKNRYKQLIEIVFPEFNLIFNDLYSDLALNFIHDFPHPDLFVNRRTDYLMNYLKDKKLFKIINSIPGFGEFSTALFLSEVGNVTRFNNSKQFKSFLGIDSVINQSGISIHYGPISKSGNKFGRTILFNIVTTIIQISSHSNQNNPIYLFFRKKQSEGKHHYKCIIACETKLCKIIYKLCSSNCLYINK